MALNPAYLADKSALARMTVEAVRARLEPLLLDGVVATCGVVDLERISEVTGQPHEWVVPRGSL